MTNAQKLTLELIRYKIAGTPLSHEFSQGISDDDLGLVYEISTSQGVVGIVAEALSDLNMLDGEIKQVFFSSQLANIYVTEQIKFELESISSLFESEKIAFIPLKGSVLRNYYPKPEMRESCDIDILIHESDLDRAGELLQTHLNYTYKTKTPHDVSFYSPSSVFLELHYTLGINKDTQNGILNRVWDYAYLQEKYEYRHELKVEFFVAYHMIHIAKHIVNGGCGVRPFIDLKIIKDNFAYDKDTFNQLITQAQLSEFSNAAFRFVGILFDGAETDETMQLLLDYIFSAGIYGSLENQMVTSLVKNGNKFKNLTERIFLPYNQIKHIYPILDKYPILTPWYEIKRWKRIIFKDKAKHQIRMIKYNASITDERKKNVTKLMENLGLNERK